MKKYIPLFVCVLLIGGIMSVVLNNDYAAPVQAQVETVQAQVENGWVESAATWTYVSADAPSFVVSVNADMTAVLSPGMRWRGTQTTVKYAIITAVGAYSGGATPITLYGGTDYTIADAAISAPAYSPQKAPFGFPLDPDKWTVEVANTSNVEQSSPVNDTWYNVDDIDIPIGVWNVSYSARASGATSGSQYSWNMFATLSTGASNESNSHMTDTFGFATASTLFIPGDLLQKSDVISAASKTTYYLNMKTTSTVDAIGLYGSSIPIIIRAVCAYL